MPPWDEVVDALKYTMLLPFAVSGAVYLVMSFFKLSRPGLIVALIAGFLVANGERDAVAFRIDVEKALTLQDLYESAHADVSGLKSHINAPSPRYWLPWVALMVGLAGLIADAARMPLSVRIAIRVFTCIVVARLLVPLVRRIDDAGLWQALAVLIFVNWYLLERMLREYARLISSLAIVLTLNLAGLVLLYAHSIRLNDIAVITGSGFLAVALIARWRKQDVRGIAPILAVMLPSLMLIGDSTHTSEVPRTSFVLVALSPLMLVTLPILKCLKCTRRRWLWLSLALFLVPSILAVILAARVETLAID